MSYLIGSLAKGTDDLNGMVNVASLGFCFLGGAFVPLDVMSSGVKRQRSFSRCTGTRLQMSFWGVCRRNRSDRGAAGGGDPACICGSVCVHYAGGGKKRQTV